MGAYDTRDRYRIRDTHKGIIMKEITQTTVPQRIKHSFFFASASAWFVGLTQLLSRERVEQVFLSSWVDFWQTIVSSFVNWSIYNLLKYKLHLGSKLSEQEVIKISIIIVSILWVWAPKYLIHKMAWTSNPELLSLLYTIWNIVTLWLYEKYILQPNK